MTNALDIQEGGGHYKKLKIQPIEYIHANALDFFQGNIIKYATRHHDKNGAEDLRKVIHYAQLALQLQYGEGLKDKPQAAHSALAPAPSGWYSADLTEMQHYFKTGMFTALCSQTIGFEYRKLQRHKPFCVACCNSSSAL